MAAFANFNLISLLVQGDLYVNGQVKIIERDISYHEGVAFGIAEVLLPPGVAGRCDEIIHEKILVRFSHSGLSIINKVSLV